MKPNEINLRDPFVLKENGKTYLYGTYGKNAWGGKALGIYVYVSKNMEDFVEKRVFSPSKDFWADENFWAPEVHRIDGKYYMFASFFKRGQPRRSHVLVSDAPDGAFTPLPEPLTPAELECLDATYFEENKNRYTVFCHEWKQCKDGEMLLAPLDGNLNLSSPPKLLFRASEAPWAQPFDGGNYVTDGPFLHRLKSGKLLMLWSSNGKNGYAMGFATADKIEGPWRQNPVPLVDCDGGHGMLFYDGDDLFLTYHRPNLPSGAERPCFVRVKETENGLELCEGQ